MLSIYNYIKKNFYSIFKFGLVGILTTIIYLLFIFIFYDIFKLDYRISISLAYIIGVFMQFISNQLFTFKIKKISFVHIKKYSLLPIINYIHTLLTSLIIVGQLSYTPYISAIISTVLSAIISFLYFKHYVFEEASN
jgi:putative flippase GtrA